MQIDTGPHLVPVAGAHVDEHVGVGVLGELEGVEASAWRRVLILTSILLVESLLGILHRHLHACVS